MDRKKSCISPLASTLRVRESVKSAGGIKTIPEKLRPRERLLAHGGSALDDSELLAIVLRTGTKGCSALDIACKLLEHYGSLRDLVNVGPDELQDLKIPGLSETKAVEVAAVLEIARRSIVSPESRNRTALNNPGLVADLLRPMLVDAVKEYFVVLPLDRKNRLIGRPVEVSVGTVDSSLVHPREVFSVCVRLSAVSVIVAHNHPSGDPKPSKEDISVTRQLRSAGVSLGIPLLDHIVIGDLTDYPPGYVSIRSEGVVSFD